jgi:hypothetical protein
MERKTIPNRRKGAHLAPAIASFTLFPPTESVSFARHIIDRRWNG